MRITFISPSFYPAFFYGGPIYSTYYNIQELTKLGVEVFVSTTDLNGKERLTVVLNKFIKHSNNFFIKYYSSSSSKGFSFRMAIGLWADIKKGNMIYTQSVFSPSTPFVFLFSKMLKKPVLFSPRGELGEWCLQQGNRFKKQWLRLLIKPFAHYINWHVTGVQESDDLQKIFPGVNFFLIPNGIDLSEYSEVPSKKDKIYFRKYAPDINSGSYVVISMGRLHAKKGFDVLVSSFSEFIKDKPNSFLFIAGEDYGEKEKLLSMIKNFSLEYRVFLIGQINDIKEKISFLSNADLFALSSHNENFGIVYAEALAAGTPIVASLNTPWKEVEESHCGRWVNNTVDEFFKAMTELNSMDSKTLSLNAKKLAAKYNWQNIALSFKEVFNKILSGSNDV